MTTPESVRPTIRIPARGAVSCFGVGESVLWQAVRDGESGIRPRERLHAVDCLTDVVAEVPRVISAEVQSDEALPLHLAVLAAGEALKRWGRTPDDGLELILASTKADMTGITTSSGEGRGSPFRLARQLADALQIPGPVTAVSCACASGLSALGLAGRRLRARRAERILVVGTDSINPFVLRGFSSLLALSTTACRPFDRGRDGLSVGDGAGAILLSTHPEDASDLELLGWGESNDANHITGPSRDGDGLASAIERALSNADIPPAAVDFVHLHGTGTQYNDAMESKAMARVFDTSPPASGSKAQIGHTLGAAGILESMITLAALECGTVPPNVGFSSPDPDCFLDLRSEIRPLERARTALKLAAGFGGINAALVFGRNRT